MSQMLPHTVRIKRKRQDEPVETLHVHTHDDPKKRRFTLDQPASSYPTVFRRVQEPDPSAALPEHAPTAAAVASAANLASSASSSRPSSSLSLERRILTPASATRRFHLSTKSAPSPSGPAGGIQKRKNVATLIETKPKKTRTVPGDPEIAEYVAQKTAAARHDDDEQMRIDEPPSQPTLKRPGRTARSASPAAAVTIQQAGMSNGNAPPATKPQALDDKKAPTAVDPSLLSEMQKFAQEVEHAEEPTPAPKHAPFHYPATTATPPHTPQQHQKLKFQPKATPRYRERHPEAAAMATDAKDVAMANNNDSDSDADEYVYDTYILYDGPPETELVDPLNAPSLPPDIGLLVISAADQPLWDAYMEAGAGVDDSDKEFDTDDEDENAEDFYANEYPEDEVASDDERDEGAYGYRVGASDEEEWGEGAYSDEEDGVEEEMRRPWGKRPAWLKAVGEGGKSDGE